MFFVWPFFTLIYSVFNYRSKYFKNIVWLASGFFGSTFYLSEKRNDAHYYRDLLVKYHQIHDIDFFEFVATLFSKKSHFEDQFYPILNYLVSRFTDNFYILYTILGLMYGYFLSRNLDFIIQRTKSTLNRNALWLILFFFFLAPIWNLYNVRFWLTVHYFFFFAIRYLNKKDLKYLILASLSIMMHFSFVFPCILLILYHIIGNRYWIYMFLFFFSLVFLKIEVGDILSLLPRNIGYADSKIIAYTTEDYVTSSIENADNRIWLVKIRTSLLIYLNLVLVMFLFIFNRKRLIVNEFNKSLFSFSILFFAMSSFLVVIPTMDRFIVVSTMFLVTLYFLVFQEYNINKFAKGFSLIYIAPIVLYCLVEIRIGMEMISTDTIILNPLISWLFNHDTSLIQLIK